MGLSPNRLRDRKLVPVLEVFAFLEMRSHDNGDVLARGFKTHPNVGHVRGFEHFPRELESTCIHAHDTRSRGVYVGVAVPTSQTRYAEPITVVG